ncbi:30S ribosomal protein S14 [Euzebya sp.]|uniref:30S ribosomal protein S14 n=1 Tax=Euzebya sp. TaxID=1971409 RepID=UPI003513D6DE
MAKKSKIVQNQKRAEMVARQAARRAELKAIVKDPDVDFDAKLEARDALNKMKVNGSPVRLRNRDRLNGRPRGHVGFAGLSRVSFRELAHNGELPGITKSSW